MSTQIATREETGTAISTGAAGMTFERLKAQGDELIRTGFLPRSIKTGAQFAAIALVGQEMGIGTMRAIRSLHCVEGNVTEKADSQLARFKAQGGRSEFRELSADKAILWLRHPNGDEHVESYTVEDAKAAELLGKDNWRKNRKAMLRSRCITAALKSIGWEGSVGTYDPEELNTYSPRHHAEYEVMADGEIIEPVQQAGPGKFEELRDAISQVKTVGLLGRYGDRVDSAASLGLITAEQANELERLIDARHDQIEPKAEVANG